jgi:hypothetical protein
VPVEDKPVQIQIGWYGEGHGLVHRIVSSRDGVVTCAPKDKISQGPLCCTVKAFWAWLRTR